MRPLAAVLALLWMGAALAPLGLARGEQDKKQQQVPVPQHPKVDQKKVDEAIQEGCKFLLGGGAMDQFTHGQRNQPPALQATAELVLLTCAHSGYYTEDDPGFARLIEFILEKKITSTYTASLHAMALQKINPRKYQWRIAQCAQFLADNQATNGQWCYGEPTPDAEEMFPVPTGGSGKKRDDVATSGGGAPGTTAGARPPPKKEVGRTAPLPRIPVRKRKPGPPNGDNSNSQYAALGVRACLDAGIEFEREVLTRARQWWVGSQNRDGGWGYNGNGVKDESEGREDSVGNSSYGSMTVGAVGALCIYDYYLGMNYRADAAVTKGMDWITANFMVDKNPKKVNFARFYYLYGLERAGILYGTEKFGPNEWYPVGANWLLDNQSSTGIWSSGDRGGTHGQTADSCFAILFLRRGTAPLKRENVATEPAGPKPGKPVANANPGLAAGAGAVDPVSKAFEGVSKGWTVENAGGGLNTGLRKELRGRENVFETFPSSASAGCILSKKVEVPFAKKPVLRLVVGHSPQGEWKLIVRVDGKDVFEKGVGPQTAKDTWLTVEVNLADFSGKVVQLELINMPTGNGVPTAAWAEIGLRGD